MKVIPTIRLAAPSDAAELLSIYAQYIDTPITFETELPSVAEFGERIHGTLASYPYLVCECSGRIAGYAYAHRYKERAAYRWDAELSVYVGKERHGRGIGKALYTALLELLKLQHVKTVYGIVTLPNAQSEGLHKALGFRCAGVARSTGYKCGRWHDVAWYEKQTGAYETVPPEFLPFARLDDSAVSAVLSKAARL